MQVYNIHAKIPYYYDRYTYDEVTDELLKSILYKRAERKSGHVRIKTHGNKNGRGITYLDITAGFDIETTTDVETERAYMYIWQMCLNGVVIKGRDYKSSIELLDRCKTILQPKENHRLLCFIHNMSYEFSFYKFWWNLNDPKQNFLKSEVEPLKLTHDGFIEFRDSMALCGGNSLSGLAKDYTNTQKCKDESGRESDLDYSIPRNKYTVLTDNEELYCDNDVLILSDYCEYVFNNILNVYTKLPLTQTGLLTNECKYQLHDTYKDIEQWHKYNTRRSAPDETTYHIQSNYLYRGGYTHAHANIVEDILTDLMGVDITSSYPYCMCQPIYAKKFEPCDITTESEVLEVIESGKVAIFIANFKNLKSKGLHSIESESKALKLSKDATIDNGRIYYASECEVYLTSWDFLNYKHYYEWSSVEIKRCEVSDTRYMYKHLVQPMLRYYKLKADLKKNSEPYSIPKARVNTFYGLNVKRLNDGLTTFSTLGYGSEDAKPYDEQIANSITCFYDGVMISAYARYRLLTLAYEVYEKFGIKSVYMDTDSHKFLNPTKSLVKYLTNINEAIRESNRKNIEYFTEYDEAYEDLGEWDIEFYPFSMYDPNSKKAYIKRFKTLGAKRYIIEVDEYNKKKGCRETTLHQTVAGLPKGEMIAQYGTIDCCFEQFHNNMKITGCKLTSKYCNEPFDITITDTQGHTDTQRGLSCNALIPCNFSLSIDDIWRLWYSELALKQYDSNRENRII